MTTVTDGMHVSRSILINRCHLETTNGAEVLCMETARCTCELFPISRDEVLIVLTKWAYGIFGYVDIFISIHFLITSSKIGPIRIAKCLITGHFFTLINKFLRVISQYCMRS